VGILKNGNYIVVDKDGSLTLTESGRAIAEKIFERHTLLTNWLISLGVPADVADCDACRIEHVISAESFDAIKKKVIDGQK
jgi:Mn-dependent DtxR family transcriptional regulator